MEDAVCVDLGGDEFFGGGDPDLKMPAKGAGVDDVVRAYRFYRKGFDRVRLGRLHRDHLASGAKAELHRLWAPQLAIDLAVQIDKPLFVYSNVNAVADRLTRSAGEFDVVRSQFHGN